MSERARNELQNKYDELIKDRLDEPVKWASDDIENIGDWEYQAELISFDSPEQLSQALNELGNERWELMWIEKSGSEFLIVLKRPSVSWLSRIPLSQIGQFITPTPEAN